jgi:hypothetical protein
MAMDFPSSQGKGFPDPLSILADEEELLSMDLFSSIPLFV